MNARRVLIADDHEVWRHGLKIILEPSFQVVAEACDGDEAIEQAVRSHPDVAILDVGMPFKDGISAAKEIHQQLPHTKVVLVSASDAEDTLEQAVMAGVNGYVLKDESPERILDAVEQVANGKGYLPPRIAKRVLEAANRIIGKGVLLSAAAGAGLSHREVEVLQLLAEGKTHKQIGNRLQVSQRTVGSHISRIYSKLGTEDRARTLALAMKRGILTID